MTGAEATRIDPKGPTRARLDALLAGLGLTDPAAVGGVVSALVGRRVGHVKELGPVEARRVIELLEGLDDAAGGGS